MPYWSFIFYFILAILAYHSPMSWTVRGTAFYCWWLWEQYFSSRKLLPWFTRIILSTSLYPEIKSFNRPHPAKRKNRNSRLIRRSWRQNFSEIKVAGDHEMIGECRPISARSWRKGPVGTVAAELIAEDSKTRLFELPETSAAVSSETLFSPCLWITKSTPDRRFDCG